MSISLSPDFSEIIDFLHSVVVPILEYDLRKYCTQERGQPKEVKEMTYQLSDIFGTQEE